MTITEPAENTQVSSGDSITARWTGTIKYQNSVYDPLLDIYRFDPGSGRFIPLLGFDPGAYHLQAGDTSKALTLPENFDPQYVIQLSVPGDLTQTDDPMGFCGLYRRVHLINQSIMGRSDTASRLKRHSHLTP